MRMRALQQRLSALTRPARPRHAGLACVTLPSESVATKSDFPAFSPKLLQHSVGSAVLGGRGGSLLYPESGLVLLGVRLLREPPGLQVRIFE